MSTSSLPLPALPGGHLAVAADHGAAPNGTGAIVLSGSSGRVETERADLLSAGSGADVLTWQWFGAKGMPKALWQYPLESFDPAIDYLADHYERVVLIGNSKSAEAFLLKAVADERISAVIAIAPSHIVWANVGPGPDGELRPCKSSWTVGGDRVPFVPYDDAYKVKGKPPEYLGMYEQSLLTYCEIVPDAVIPVERISGELLLIAGGDDRVWPSLETARWVELTRSFYELPTTVVTHPDAGHRVILPGESPAAGGQEMARGGTEAADRTLGELAWPEIVRVLGGSAH